MVLEELVAFTASGILAPLQITVSLDEVTLRLVTFTVVVKVSGQPNPV